MFSSIFLLFCFGGLTLILIIALAQAVKVVQQYERGVILRLGKYAKTAEPGIIFLVPFLDTMISTDMRERVINVPPQDVITEDNVTVSVDAVVYYKVVDPVKAVFEVEDFDLACTTLAQTNLRNVIGDMSLDESLTSRDKINVNLRDVLDEATNPWGVKITRVEVKRIDPPTDITEAMSRQMKAERNKRAAILEAEGIKQSRILTAEGEKQSEILKAEGDARAEMTRADGEAKAIEIVSNAAATHFKGQAETLKRLEITRDSLKNNTKFVIPDNSDLINILGEGTEQVIPVEKKSV